MEFHRSTSWGGGYFDDRRSHATCFYVVLCSFRSPSVVRVRRVERKITYTRVHVWRTTILDYVRLLYYRACKISRKNGENSRAKLTRAYQSAGSRFAHSEHDSCVCGGGCFMRVTWSSFQISSKTTQCIWMVIGWCVCVIRANCVYMCSVFDYEHSIICARIFFWYFEDFSNKTVLEYFEAYFLNTFFWRNTSNFSQ